MAKTKEQIAATAEKNRKAKIAEARAALETNDNLRGYLSAQRHPFDNTDPNTLQQRSLLTYYEWGLKKARHYKQYEIAKDILKLPVARLKRGGDVK